MYMYGYCPLESPFSTLESPLYTLESPFSTLESPPFSFFFLKIRSNSSSNFFLLNGLTSLPLDIFFLLFLGIRFPERLVIFFLRLAIFFLSSSDKAHNLTARIVKIEIKSMLLINSNKPNNV